MEDESIVSDDPADISVYEAHSVEYLGRTTVLLCPVNSSIACTKNHARIANGPTIVAVDEIDIVQGDSGISRDVRALPLPVGTAVCCANDHSVLV